MSDTRAHRATVCWTCGWACQGCDHGNLVIPHRQERRPYVMLSDAQIAAHRGVGHEVAAVEFRP